MLQAIFFYLFIWWFVKLESKKSLTVRAVLAGIFAACCFAIAIGAIFLLAETADIVATILLILYIILFILFLIRSLCDISKIRDLSAAKGKEQEASSQNANTKPKTWL